MSWRAGRFDPIVSLWSVLAFISLPAPAFYCIGELKMMIKRTELLPALRKWPPPSFVQPVTQKQMRCPL